MSDNESWMSHARSNPSLSPSPSPSPSLTPCPHPSLSPSLSPEPYSSDCDEALVYDATFGGTQQKRHTCELWYLRSKPIEISDNNGWFVL